MSSFWNSPRESSCDSYHPFLAGFKGLKQKMAVSLVGIMLSWKFLCSLWLYGRGFALKKHQLGSPERDANIELEMNLSPGDPGFDVHAS